MHVLILEKYGHIQITGCGSSQSIKLISLPLPHPSNIRGEKPANVVIFFTIILEKYILFAQLKSAFWQGQNH